MHPLAHLLTGALIGQATGSPALAAAGGLLSHAALDAIPHAEGKTFQANAEAESDFPRKRTAWELAEAGVEAAVGVLLLAWLTNACRASQTLPIAVGALAAIVPDMVDLPLRTLTGRSVLHVRRWHWTVSHRYALWGILTQVAVIAAAAILLWRAARCG